MYALSNNLLIITSSITTQSFCIIDQVTISHVTELLYKDILLEESMSEDGIVVKRSACNYYHLVRILSNNIGSPGLESVVQSTALGVL